MAWYNLFKRKKNDEFGLAQPSLTKLELGLPIMEKEPSQSAPLTPMFDSPAERPSAFEIPHAPQKDLSKDIEIISAKLDAIKAMIENLNHRLDKIESAQPQKDKKYSW